MMADDAVLEDKDWYSNETATLGDRLAGARNAVGMSEDELAKRLGVKRATLESWENDLSEPRANRLSMLAGILNVSLRWLLTGEGEGITAPGATGTVPDGTHDILMEMRTLQSEIVQAADRLGFLEKRLRQTMAGK
ncbi:helix-turn-helix domain-containing protein [Palleronia aestuarii]